MTSEIGPAGRWICQTCGFQLTTAILRAADGAVGVNRRPVEDICPNDGTSMRPITWEEDAADANRVALEQMKRADELEALLLQRAQEIAELKIEIRDYEEREAAVCPEDVGFDEYIGWLTKQLAARAQEIEQVKADLHWQPIETMPRDGRDVLVLHPAGEVCISYWGSIRGVEGIKSKLHRSANGGEGDFCRDAMHWMRLPSAAEAALVSRAPQQEQKYAETPISNVDVPLVREAPEGHMGQSSAASERVPVETQAAAPLPASAALQARLQKLVDQAVSSRAIVQDQVTFREYAESYAGPRHFGHNPSWVKAADLAAALSRADQP